MIWLRKVTKVIFRKPFLFLRRMFFDADTLGTYLESKFNFVQVFVFSFIFLVLLRVMNICWIHCDLNKLADSITFVVFVAVILDISAFTYLISIMTWAIILSPRLTCSDTEPFSLAKKIYLSLTAFSLPLYFLTVPATLAYKSVWRVPKSFLVDATRLIDSLTFCCFVSIAMIPLMALIRKITLALLSCFE